MEITRTQNGATTVFTLVGRLDSVTAPRLQEMLIPEFATAAHVELDFASLTYISSAGLRVLLLGEKTAKGKDGTMKLSGVLPEVREIFEMTGFSDILKIA